jgi:hypothetical protein
LSALDLLRTHTPAPLRPALAAAHRFVDVNLANDRSFIRRQYAAVFGRPPDLVRPSRFSEKIQWRKLNDRRPEWKIFCDKLATRDYVTTRLGPSHVAPLAGVYDCPEQLPWMELPVPCVIKASHATGMNLFIFDRDELEPVGMSRTMRRWLKTDHYRHGREWGYKDLPRKILVEGFLGDGRQAPDDFRLLCFDGVPRFVYVVHDRFGQATLDWYNPDWVPAPLRSVRYPRAEVEPAAPSLLPEMLEAAARLSAGFDFLRVDLYCAGGRVRCGELTVYPGCGLERFDPPEADEMLGQLWKLPRRA